MKSRFIIAILALFAVIALSVGSVLFYRVDTEKCIGCGKCTIHCPTKAITMENRKAVIDPGKCISCGVCEKVCPIKVIYPVYGQFDSAGSELDITSFPVLDSAQCVSCGECARVCPVKAISMVDAKPVIDTEKCVRCGACVLICPTGAIFIPEEKDS
jgi:energy-converting hydrogenase A subunit P